MQLLKTKYVEFFENVFSLKSSIKKKKKKEKNLYMNIPQNIVVLRILALMRILVLNIEGGGERERERGN